MSNILIFEPLQAYHDRQGFDCGNPPLNDFLQRQARQNAGRNGGITHVAVEEAGDSKIIAYYTLVTRAMLQVEQSAREIGIYALVLDAHDEDARAWYLGLGMGFDTLLDSHTHLYLPVDTIRTIMNEPLDAPA